ncbi:hypothetical protein QQ045_022068 [Rhodiola kirilowii]
MAEAKVSAEPVGIDAPGGFLYEWWSIFWEMHAASGLRQGNTVGMSAAFQKVEYRNQPGNDTRPQGNLSGAQRPLPMDHSPANVMHFTIA